MEKTNETVNGWSEYKRLVLQQLEYLNEKYKEINDKLDTVKTKVVVLETKAFILGIIASAVMTILLHFLKV
jgi:hypothetical protein